MIFEELIKAKYKISKNYYKKIFSDEDSSVFLSYFDIMNVQLKMKNNVQNIFILEHI